MASELFKRLNELQHKRAKSAPATIRGEAESRGMVGDPGQVTQLGLAQDVANVRLMRRRLEDRTLHNLPAPAVDETCVMDFDVPLRQSTG